MNINYPLYFAPQSKSFALLMKEEILRMYTKEKDNWPTHYSATDVAVLTKVIDSIAQNIFQISFENLLETFCRSSNNQIKCMLSLNDDHDLKLRIIHNIIHNTMLTKEYIECYNHYENGDISAEMSADSNFRKYLKINKSINLPKDGRFIQNIKKKFQEVVLEKMHDLTGDFNYKSLKNEINNFEFSLNFIDIGSTSHQSFPTPQSRTLQNSGSTPNALPLTYRT